MAGFLTPPLIDASTRRNLLEFPHGNYPAKTKGMGQLYDYNFIIVTGVPFLLKNIWELLIAALSGCM